MLESLKLKLAGAWRSFTVWLNGLLGTLLMLAEPAKEYIPQVQAFLTPDLYKYLFFAMVALNIGLRFKTKDDLASKG